MNDSTKPSDRPSLPATRYRSFKMFAVNSCIGFDAGLSSANCASSLPILEIFD
jgi:hypothetical protein